MVPEDASLELECEIRDTFNVAQGDETHASDVRLEKTLKWSLKPKHNDQWQPVPNNREISEPECSVQLDYSPTDTYQVCCLSLKKGFSNA